MAKCPSCDNSIEADFGLVTCKNCKAVLMVDALGDIQVGSDMTHQEEATSSFEEEPVEFEDNQSDFSENPISEAADDFQEAIDEPIEDTFEEPFEEFSDESIQAADEDITGEFEDPVNLESPVDEPGVAEDPSDGFEAEAHFEDPVEENSYEAEGNEDSAVSEPEVNQQEDALFEPTDDEPQEYDMATEPDADPVDITDFANSEVSSLEDGELVYDVMISRLDSKDLKEALKYVLLDDKLKLNHHEYLKSIRDGKVSIPNLNPIKAKRIVEQLQYYDVDIKWVQKRVVMEVIEPEMIDEDGEEVNEDANV